MMKTNVVAGLLALALFGTAQYQGWSIFHAAAQSTSGASGSRLYHK